MAEMPVIDGQKCRGCGLCVSVCACGILSLRENKASLEIKEECHGCTNWCTLCESVCPSQAISCSFEIIIEDK